MEIKIKFEKKEQLQNFFLDAQDLLEKHSAIVSPDKEGSEAMKEVTEKVED